jgi:hypothetical protein
MQIFHVQIYETMHYFMTDICSCNVLQSTYPYATSHLKTGRGNLSHDDILGHAESVPDRNSCCVVSILLAPKMRK